MLARDARRPEGGGQTLEGKVGEQGEVIDDPARLGQPRKDEEALPAGVAPGRPAPDAVDADGYDVHVGLGDAIAAEDLDGDPPVDGEQDEGEGDTDGEDDLGDLKADQRRLLEGVVRPAIVGEQDDGGVAVSRCQRSYSGTGSRSATAVGKHLHIGGIAGDGEQSGHVDPEIGGVVEARSRREIGQIL